MPGKFDFIDAKLQDRIETDRLRQLQPLVPQQDGITVNTKAGTYVNFCSNDYLGLSHHPDLIKRAKERLDQYGAGATASRLVSGSFDIHGALEDKIAATFNKEAALLLNSGFQANSSIIGAITDRHSLILADKLCHNSLLQGSLLSRAKLMRFEHNDMRHLEILLKQAREKTYSRILIITETVFSMDGDRCNINDISRLAQKHDTLLYVDEAHAVGVWGKKGMGLATNFNNIDILLGTCGKAFGGFGAYIACSQKMKDYLINFCPGFIYTTALSPPVVGAIEAALELIPTLQEERKQYQKRIKDLRSQIEQAGFDTGPSSTQIIPLIVGDESRTIELSNHLKQQGILARAIRPPTVPEHSSRIRLTLSMAHQKDHITRLLNALQNWKDD